MKTTQTAGGRTRALIYCRISQDRTGAGLGVDRQREDCEALAARMDWDVLEVYVDNDISAFSGKKRPAYRRMLADLDEGKATVVIVWHTDRLTRSIVELEEYIDLSDRRGISTHTVQAGTVDLATPSGRMTARILGAVHRQESEHKGERVGAAGRRTGPPPPAPARSQSTRGSVSPARAGRRPSRATGWAASARSGGACPPARRRRRSTGRPAKRSRFPSST